MNNFYYNWNPFAAERNALKHDANYIGIIALVLTGLLRVIFTLILLVLSLCGIADYRAVNSYFDLGSTGFLLAYAVAYCIGMGLPAPLVTVISRRRIRPFSRYEQPGEEEKQLQPFTIILALMAGLAVCILANIATAYILTIFNQFGIQPPKMPSYMNKSGISLLLNVVIFAFFPAILEEMVYRGYILRTFRRYGNGFAVLVSSLLFALMHGNILQIPFAFIVGMACGYLVIHTGRIWPAMMLHFLNNFMSTLLQYFQLFTGSEQQNQYMTLIVFVIIGLLGIISLVILYITNDPIVQQLRPRIQGGLSGGQKAGALFTAPAFLISILFSLVLTVISTIGGVA